LAQAYLRLFVRTEKQKITNENIWWYLNYKSDPEVLIGNRRPVASDEANKLILSLG